MKRFSILAAILSFGLGMLAGCASSKMTVSGGVLTSGVSLSQGKRVEATKFSRDDYIVQLVDFSWDQTGQPGGRHDCVWNWYKGDKLVSFSRVRALYFTGTPFTIETKRAAATLGTGRFHIDAIVDGTTVATSTFDITP